MKGRFSDADGGKRCSGGDGSGGAVLRGKTATKPRKVNDESRKKLEPDQVVRFDPAGNEVITPRIQKALMRLPYGALSVVRRAARRRAVSAAQLLRDHFWPMWRACSRAASDAWLLADNA